MPTYPFAVPSGVDLYPASSGFSSVGTTNRKFASIYANQYATTLVSGTGGTVNINWNNGASQILSFVGIASGSYTIGFSNGIPGSAYVLETIQNYSGTASLAFSGAQTAWQGGVTGVMTASSGVKDIFSFFYDGSKYLGAYSSNYF